MPRPKIYMRHYHTRESLQKELKVRTELKKRKREFYLQHGRYPNEYELAGYSPEEIAKIQAQTNKDIKNFGKWLLEGFVKLFLVLLVLFIFLDAIFK
jgi:hypothetical protein